jgi:hypothetical protein
MPLDDEPKRHLCPAFTEMRKDAQKEAINTMIYLVLYIPGPLIVLRAVTHKSFDQEKPRTSLLRL